MMIRIGLLWALTSFAQHESSGFSYPKPRHYRAFDQGQVQSHLQLSQIDDRTQHLVDRAVELMHGFWIHQAEATLLEAQRLAPQHPVIMALQAFNQTIFGSGDIVRGRSYLDAARRLESKTLNHHERLWFEVCEAAYDTTVIPALEKLVAVFPEDLEAKAFLALHRWLKLVADNNGLQDPELYRLQTDQMIREVLNTKPLHPAHHYKIHLWNRGIHNSLALSSARASGPAQALTAHLWHMPAHIFTATGDLHHALRHIEIAHRVDHQQMAINQIMPTEIHNYVHNFRDFGLPLLARVGDLNELVERSVAVLSSGRQANVETQAAHASMAIKLMQQLEAFQAWDLFDQLDAKGIFDDLGDVGSEFWMRRQRMRVIARVVYDHNVSALVEEAEAAAQPESAKIVVDMRLRMEIAMRKPVPDFYFDALAELKVTSSLAIAQLAIHYGRADLAPRWNTAWSSLDTLGMVQKLWVEAKLGVTNNQVWLKKIAEISSPRADYATTSLAKDYPGLVQRIKEMSAVYAAERERNQHPSMNYLYSKPIDTYGPADPLRWKLDDRPSRYELRVFMIGAECTSCMEQVAELRKIKDQLAELEIDLHLITLTETRIEGFIQTIDADATLHREATVWDAFRNDARHGTLLLNPAGEVLWQHIDEHPFMDIGFLASEARRLVRIDRPSED